MRKALPVLAFAAVLGIHYSWFQHNQGSSPWLTLTPDGAEAQPAGYVSSGSVWLGLSYGVAASFVAFSLARLIEFRRRGVAGAVGGLTLTGILYATGCFLLGCCGSPMLAVYVGLFGPRFLGFTGPIVFGFTVLSVAIGFVWVTRKTRTIAGVPASTPAGEASCNCSASGASSPHWIEGTIDTPVGEVARTTPRLTWRDR